eukprot:359440-Chlamydomonas_euryale.AAC.3
MYNRAWGRSTLRIEFLLIPGHLNSCCTNSILWYGDRYDFRRNMIDWDYHMRMIPVCLCGNMSVRFAGKSGRPWKNALTSNGLGFACGRVRVGKEWRQHEGLFHATGAGKCLDDFSIFMLTSNMPTDASATTACICPVPWS